MKYNILHCNEYNLRFRQVKEKRCIDTDYDYIGDVEAEDLEEAFAHMNRIENSEFTNFTPKESLPVRSLSVGDILKFEDQYWAVDNIGFSEVMPTYDGKNHLHYIEPEEMFYERYSTKEN